MNCPRCGSENSDGRKFCGECGAGLAQACPACGSAIEPGTKFCGECGAALTGPAAPDPGATPPAAATPAAERRLVSVLFADLVGFTTLSEGRDSEEVRELLSPLLRGLAAADRALRRHRREVHRRRRHGGLGHARSPRRTTPSGPCGPRSTWSRPSRALGDEIGVPDLRARAGVLTGEATVNGRRRRPGHGRRRHREHRSADPVGRRAGAGARRRSHPASDRADHRVRGCRHARAEGQVRPLPALAGGAGRLGRPRRAQVGGSRGPVRRPRPRAAPDQGPLPRVGRRAPRPPRLGDRHRRYRQVAARVGVLQVLRRPRPDHLLAPRPLPVLRRGRHLLGAGRHGADALPYQRGRARRRRAREARGRASRSTSPTRTSAASSSPASPT